MEAYKYLMSAPHLAVCVFTRRPERASARTRRRLQRRGGEESRPTLGEEELQALQLHCVWVNIKPHYWGVIENLCSLCSI